MASSAYGASLGQGGLTPRPHGPHTKPLYMSSFTNNVKLVVWTYRTLRTLLGKKYINSKNI